MNTLEQLSDSLLAACRIANITEPKYITQDEDGTVWHYDGEPDTTLTSDVGIFAFDADIGEHAILLNHKPYTANWQDSLLEWVDHVADTSKKVDMQDAIADAYRTHVGRCGLQTYAQTYRQGWLDALAWKGGEEL